MATKLYLHAAAYSFGGTVPINQTGGAAPALQGGNSLQDYNNAGVDATSVSRSMNKVKGTVQSSIVFNIDNNTATHSYYLTKFISDPLQAQTISAQTWKYNGGMAEGNTAVDMIGLNPITVYVWRPSTGALVGSLIFNAAPTGFVEPSATGVIKLNKVTFSGAAVTVQAGDVLIFEIWYRLTAGSTPSNWQVGFYYDGTVDYDASAVNTTITDVASFLEIPQDLAFTTDLRNLVQTITHTLALTSDHTRLKRLNRDASHSLALVSTHSRLRNKIRNIASVLLSDNFEAGTYSFTEGGLSPNSLWTNQYLGGVGATSGVRLSASIGNNVMFQKPQVSTSAGETHATYNLATSQTFTDFDMTVDLRNVAQLRTGSPANAWEVAWILFRHTDSWHHYYLALKPSGIELGRKDYATQIEQQIFLVTNGTPFTVIGRWENVRIKAVGNRFTVWVNGTLAFDFLDDGSVGYDTNTGGLPAPPSIAMYSGYIGLYNEDAEVEFNNFSVSEVHMLKFTSTHPRLRGKWRTATHALTLTVPTHTRLTTRLRTIVHALTLTPTHTRIKQILPRTITHALAITSGHTRLRGLVQTVQHSLILLETSLQTRQGVKTIAHFLILTSDHTRIRSKNKTISHTLALISDHTRFRGLIQTVAHTLALISDHTRSRGLVQTASHSMTFTSTHVEIRGKLRTVDHNLGLSSDHTRITTRLKTIIHSLAFTSGHTRLRGKWRTISHSLAFVSDHQRRRGFIKAISHSLAFTSDHQRIRYLIQTVSHSLAFVSDHVASTLRYFYIRRFRIRSNKNNV